MDYKSAWDYQEALLQENVRAKAGVRSQKSEVRSQNSEIIQPLLAPYSSFVNHRHASSSLTQPSTINHQPATSNQQPTTRNHLLFVEHPPVFTLGKSGNMDNVLLSEERLKQMGI